MTSNSMTPEDYYKLLSIRQMLESKDGKSMSPSAFEHSLQRHGRLLQQQKPHIKQVPTHGMKDKAPWKAKFSSSSSLYDESFGLKRSKLSNMLSTRTASVFPVPNDGAMFTEEVNRNGYTGKKQRLSSSRSWDPSLRDCMDIHRGLSHAISAGSSRCASTSAMDCSYQDMSSNHQGYSNQTFPPFIDTDSIINQSLGCQANPFVDTTSRQDSFSSCIEGKRQRRISNEWANKLPMAAAPLPSKETVNNDLHTITNSPPLSPFTHKGYTESDSPMGNTPLMFAEYFLGATNEGVETGQVQVPPLPPFESKNSKDTLNDTEENTDQVEAKKRDAPKRNVPEPEAPLTLREFKSRFFSKPIRLPARRRKAVAKNKMAISKECNAKVKIDVSKASRTANYVITPSSDTIVALSAEVRKQMQLAIDTNGSASPNLLPKKEVDTKVEVECFSIPQFATSMEASQFSQQSIHDWDRKFGLRRAHSKTMRESARSRKKVLDFLKGEGANLLNIAAASTEATSKDKLPEDAGNIDEDEIDKILTSDDDFIGSFKDDFKEEEYDFIFSRNLRENTAEDEDLNRMFRRASLDLERRNSTCVTSV